MNRILCAIVVLAGLNAYTAKGIEPERIIEMYKERLGLVSNASGSYTMTRGLSGPAQALYARQKSEKNISKMWELLDILPSETRVDFAYDGDEIILIPSINPIRNGTKRPATRKAILAVIRDGQMCKNSTSTRNRDDTALSSTATIRFFSHDVLFHDRNLTTASLSRMMDRRAAQPLPGRLLRGYG